MGSPATRINSRREGKEFERIGAGDAKDTKNARGSEPSEGQYAPRRILAEMPRCSLTPNGFRCEFRRPFLLSRPNHSHTRRRAWDDSMPLAQTGFSEALGPSREDHSPPVPPEATTEGNQHTGRPIHSDISQNSSVSPGYASSGACPAWGVATGKLMPTSSLSSNLRRRATSMGSS